MVVKFDQLGVHSVLVHNEFVVVPARSNAVAFSAPFQTTNFLGMCSVFVDDSISQVPRRDASVAGAARQKSVRPVETAHAAVVSVETVDPFFLLDIVDFDLSETVAKGDPIVVAERNRTQIVTDLTRFVQFGDFGGAARPNVCLL